MALNPSHKQHCLSIPGNDQAMKKLPEHIAGTTTIRLPHVLHAQIKAAAEYNGRSMNAEIIARLSASVEATSLSEISRQNTRTHELLEQLLDAITPNK